MRNHCGFSTLAAISSCRDSPGAAPGASATGVSISGIFQAAEDFAVLNIWNAHDYFNHLRLKHLPRTDLSGLKLEFDIEYDHALDGAMRFDATKFPSVSWDAMTFVAGKGDLHEVKLLNHATAISGETPATAKVDLNSREPKYGIDYFHVFFRDTRYTVTTTDARAETTLTAPVGNDQPGEVWMPVGSTDGFETGDWIYIEKTGANKEFVYATKWITAAIRSRRTSRLPTLRAATFRSRPEAALSRRKWQS